MLSTKLNLEVGDGEVFGFLGPNGAGKSTTILMLTGMNEPTSGSCTIEGVNVALNPLRGKEILGYLPEDVGFYINLTGYENLDYLGKFYPIGKSEREERIETLMKRVGLSGVTQKVGEYSRGMPETRKKGYSTGNCNRTGFRSNYKRKRIRINKSHFICSGLP